MNYVKNDKIDFTINELEAMYDSIELESWSEVEKISNRVYEMTDSDSFVEFMKNKELPLKKGVLYINNYYICTTFNIVGDVLHVDMYLDGDKDDDTVDFKDKVFYHVFHTETDLITGYEFKKEVVRDVKQTAKDKMLEIEKKDNTCKKQILLLTVVLYYMSHYRYEPTESTSISRSERKKIERRINFRKLPLVTKKYVVSSKTQGHHVITCPSWEVRGYYRHYKNGKVIWVDGFTKGKDRTKTPEKKHYKGI